MAADPGTNPMKEPLQSAEWQFPLGRATARLSIVADKGGEILPEDMKTLAEYAALFEQQLCRSRVAATSAPAESAGLEPENPATVEAGTPRATAPSTDPI